MMIEIKKCVEVLKNDGIILYPTDTVWGIGCDATSKSAVEKIYQLKQRSESKSMIILLDDISSLPTYVESIPDNIENILSQFHQPTTVIYEGAKNLAENVIPKENTIAIRIAKHDFCRKLIQTFGKPIVSTSANISGEKSPMFYHQITEAIKTNVDYAVNLERDIVNSRKPSTIVRIGGKGTLTIIRA